jgi:hypothetical protein
MIEFVSLIDSFGYRCGMLHIFGLGFLTQVWHCISEGVSRSILHTSMHNTIEVSGHDVKVWLHRPWTSSLAAILILVSLQVSRALARDTVICIGIWVVEGR